MLRKDFIFLTFYPLIAHMQRQKSARKRQTPVSSEWLVNVIQRPPVMGVRISIAVIQDEVFPPRGLGFA
jgi:hypothetical protein